MEEIEIQELETNKDEVIDIIVNALDKGANYNIKSMSPSVHLKELLMDVKNVFNEPEFKDLLKVAINSALEEAVGVNKLNTIKALVDRAFAGGLPEITNIVIEIATTGKKIGNIFSNYIEDFVNKMKNYVRSKEFKNRIDSGVEKCMNKVDKFKSLCSSWYDAYDELNLEELEELAGQIKNMKKNVKFSNECLDENDIIQNITEIMSKKKGKISKSRMDIYENLHEI